MQIFLAYARILEEPTDTFHQMNNLKKKATLSILLMVSMGHLEHGTPAERYVPVGDTLHLPDHQGIVGTELHADRSHHADKPDYRIPAPADGRLFLRQTPTSLRTRRWHVPEYEVSHIRAIEKRTEDYLTASSSVTTRQCSSKLVNALAAPSLDGNPDGLTPTLGLDDLLLQAISRRG